MIIKYTFRLTVEMEGIPTDEAAASDIDGNPYQEDRSVFYDGAVFYYAQNTPLNGTLHDLVAGMLPDLKDAAAKQITKMQ